MDENLFLKSREERDAQRQARSRGPSDDAMHRAELLQELEELASAIRQSVETEKSYDGAIGLWRQLQERLTSSADTKTLPAHEMKSWNKALSDLSVTIEALRSSAKGPKKFAFSSKKTAPAPAAANSTTATSSSTSTAAAPSSSTNADSDPVTGAVYSDLTDVTVFVPPNRAVFVRRCHNCTFLAVPTAGSFFISDSTSCKVYLCCHQLRIKSCRSLHVFAWCSSTPVIESCTSMTLGPYTKWRGLCHSTIEDTTTTTTASSTSHATHELWAAHVGEMRDIAHAVVSWRTIDDFHWLKQAQSPNWTLLTEEELSSDAFVEDRVVPPTNNTGSVSQ